MKKEKNILKKIAKESCGARLPWPARGSIVVCCVLFDFVAFYTTYNLLLRQNQLLNILTVAVTALTIDLFPVVLAMILSRSEKDRMELGLAGTIAAGFLCEALLSVFIRINTKSMLFESGSLGLKLSGAAAQNVKEAVSADTTYAQMAVVTMLGVIPILTSLLSFAVTYENPKRRKREKREEYLLSLQEDINKHKVEIELLNKELASRNLYKLDQIRFSVADILIDLAEIGSEIKTRQEIAAVLQDVDATTILLEDQEIQDRLDHARRMLDKLITETDYDEDAAEYDSSKKEEEPNHEKKSN